MLYEISLDFGEKKKTEEINANENCDCSGYVALAVTSPAGTVTREVDTGLGGDREANMLKFAVEGLTLLRDLIKGDVKP